MAAVIGALRAELSAQIAEFTSNMNAAAGSVGKFRKRFESYGKSLQKTGAVMSAAITAPLVALASASLGDFKEQEDAIAGLEATIKSTGGAAGLTSQQLQDMANDLQKVTRYGDEDILGNATASLLKFTRITGEEFKRANTLALDVATGMKIDLAGAANLLGKALNDPVKGLRALRAMGISFTADQQAVIKKLVETGQVAEAQAMILDEVAKRFGGQAEAAATTTGGKLDVLANQWGEVKEKIGALVAEALPPLLDLLSQFVDWLNTLDPATVQWAVSIAAIAAAVGPVILAIGTMMTAISAIPAIFTGVSAAAAALGTAFTLMGGPITIAIAAIAALAAAWYLYGEQIKAKALEIYNAVAAMWADLAATLQAAFDVIVQKTTEFWNGLILLFQQFVDKIIQFFVDMKEKVIAIVAEMVDAVSAYFTEKLNAALAAVEEKIQSVIDMFKYMYDAVVGHSYVPDMIDGIETEFARLPDAMVKPAQDAAKETENAFAKIVDTVGGLLDKLLDDGKLTFDDLRKAALDLAKSLFIQPLLNSFKTAFTGGGAGGGGLLGGLFSGFFADGGTIPRGSWGIVGEQGPEPVFAGRKDLTVFPNGAGGGGVTNFYIETQNPKAFRDDRVALIRGASRMNAQAARHR